MSIRNAAMNNACQLPLALDKSRPAINHDPEWMVGIV
jgi:hypothetical protein